MNSTWIMYALLVFYAAILVAALWERNYWRALYFVGAIVISIAVLGMTGKRKHFEGGGPGEQTHPARPVFALEGRSRFNAVSRR